MKTIIFFVAFLCLLNLSVQGQEVGKEAPDFELNSLSGETFKLSNQNGNVVVVFILGYNCPFCISFAPKSESDLYQKYNSRTDFVMVGVDSWNGNKSGVESFKSKTSVTYPLLMMGSNVATQYNTTYDRLLVIDKEGILRHNNKGTAATNDLNNVITVVDEYIEKSVATSIDHSGSNAKRLFSIYPNPVKNYLNIQISSEDAQMTESVAVYDVTGKEVLYNKVIEKSENIIVDVTELPAGLFYMKIAFDNGESGIQKFIVN